MVTLRDYQRDGVEEIRAHFSRGIKKVLFVSPTASGKTVLFSHIVAGVASRQKRVMVMAHRDELLRQISAALTESNVRHGVIAGGSRGLSRASVTVASVMTLVRRLDHFKPPDLIICDEAHHCVGKTSWGKIIAACPNAYVLGVTATPCRLDGTGLGDVFQSMVIGPSVADLISRGYLAPPEVYAPLSQPDLSGIKKRGGDYASNELSMAMDRPTITGDAVTHYRRIADGKAAVAFCCSVQHAQDVAAEFRTAGYRAVSVDGNMDKDARRQAIADLASGKIQVLTSCEIISEGVDVPRIECGIMLRPTQSTGLWLQQVGRCLRIYPGKKSAIILDHAGNSLRHGLPEQEREWSLKGIVHEERDQDSGPSLRTCPECLAVHPTKPICPRCGHVYEVNGREIDHVDGDLALLTPEQMEKQKRQQARIEVGMAKDRKALERIAAARGYKPGWVKYVLQSRSKKKVRTPIYETGSISQWKGDDPV